MPLWSLRFLQVGVLTTVVVSTAGFAASVESTASFKLGYDSNVTAVDQGSAAVPKDDSVLLSGGLAWSTDFAAAAQRKGAWSAAKVNLALEANRYPDAREEDFVSARLAFAGKRETSTDILTVDASVLRIDGAEDTYNAIGTINAFGLPVWRERRTQWQERGKLQWTRTGTVLTRLGASTLIYDMDTTTRDDCVTYVDRSDSSLSAEVGRAMAGGQGWVGVQLGRQHQDSSRLTGGQYEYSNTYRRVSLAWSGKLGGRTRLSVAGGPAWHDYNGNVNPVVFADRTRSSGWFEGEAAVELSPTWTLTGKVARFLWLSSTGKSAYADLCGEVAVVNKVSKQLQWRLSGKVQQADYFPQVRDDWMASSTASVDYAVTSKWKLGADLTYQYAWSELQPVKGRNFERTYTAVRTTVLF